MIAPLDGGIPVLAAMATPAVLLLANAMLILSTNQRLQAILERVHETELTISGAAPVAGPFGPDLLTDLLSGHARRARAAQRALLCLYTSAGLFVAVVVAIGLEGLGVRGALTFALAGAFLGCVLLLCGAALLVAETWIGIGATDRRLAAAMRRCRDLAGPPPDDALT